MPLPLLGAGLELLSQGLGAFTQGIQNRVNQRRQEKMMQWEINANRENWRMQNEYNSPVQQMQRLKEAGLNPNLVYGNGATATGGNVASASGTASEGQAPRFDAGKVVSGYLDAEMRQAQIDQTKKSLQIMDQDMINKALQSQLTNAQIQKMGVETEQGKFNLGQSQRLADYSVESARLGNIKTEQDIQISAKDYVLRELKNGSELKEALTRMALNNQNTRNAKLTGKNLALLPNLTEAQISSIMQGTSESMMRSNLISEQTKQVLQQISNMQQDGTLKNLEINLKKSGLNSSDPTLLRLINALFSNQ